MVELSARVCIVLLNAIRCYLDYFTRFQIIVYSAIVELTGFTSNRLYIGSSLNCVVSSNTSTVSQLIIESWVMLRRPCVRKLTWFYNERVKEKTAATYTSGASEAETFPCLVWPVKSRSLFPSRLWKCEIYLRPPRCSWICYGLVYLKWLKWAVCLCYTLYSVFLQFLNRTMIGRLSLFIRNGTQNTPEGPIYSLELFCDDCARNTCSMTEIVLCAGLHVIGVDDVMVLVRPLCQRYLLAVLNLCVDWPTFVYVWIRYSAVGMRLTWPLANDCVNAIDRLTWWPAMRVKLAVCYVCGVCVFHYAVFGWLDRLISHPDKCLVFVCSFREPLFMSGCPPGTALYLQYNLIIRLLYLSVSLMCVQFAWILLTVSTCVYFLWKWSGSSVF